MKLVLNSAMLARMIAVEGDANEPKKRYSCCCIYIWIKQ